MSMLSLLVALLSGIITSLVACGIAVLRERYRAHKDVQWLVGKWKAFNWPERHLTPMENALQTCIESVHPPWSARSAVLRVRGEEMADGKLRRHEGILTVDSAFPRVAKRIVCYLDSHEVSVQTIVIDREKQILYVVSPTERAYQRHALCKEPCSGVE